MLRGVNRQIIEVNETGHPYFERAFLIVRSDCEETEEGEGFSREATRFLAAAGAYHGLRIGRRKYKVKRLLSGLAMAVLGAGGGFLLSLLVR